MPEAREPVSQRIRERLKKKQQRFHANDNISAFIEPGELEELTKEVAAKMSGVLESLVIDIEHNTRMAAHRAAGLTTADTATTATVTTGGDGHVNRLNQLDEESAEAALLRGH